MSIFRFINSPTTQETTDIHLNYIGLSQTHMCRNYCYSFCLAENEKGEFHLDANCFDFDGDINFENRPIKKEDLEPLFEILEKYDTKNFLKKYTPPPPSPFFVHDQTTTTFSARWTDTKILSACHTGDSGKEIETFFLNLAKKYK